VTKLGLVLGVLVIACCALGASPALASGTLASPTRFTPAGTYNGVAYVQYDGIFQGATSTGSYRVPYRLFAAPAAPGTTKRTVLVEPPHSGVGIGGLEVFLGRSFLFSRGFLHGSVGYSTTSLGPGADLRILDPSVPGVYINGGLPDGNGRTDDEIIVDFARALTTDPVAQQLLGSVDRRYITGFSDSSDPVLRLVTSGQADRVFDFALAFIAASPLDPQTYLKIGRYTGKLIILNSEFEGASSRFVDRGIVPDRYRFYAVPGTPHIPDLLVSSIPGSPIPPFWAMTTPAGFQPELRAHFLQADHWVKGGAPAMPSTRLLTTHDGFLAYDANGNAIAVDGSGQLMPRLPFIELGEAHFLPSQPLAPFPVFLTGSYESVKTIKQLGFRSPAAYVKAFGAKLDVYAKTYGITGDDADAMRKRASLCPPLTFTETYRDHYDAFVGIASCTG
jgi:hypothetical protein